MALAAVATLCFVCVTASAAFAGPTYSVMNAEGGIYWRSAPDWNTAVRVNGFGVYNGEIIEPHCYEPGAGNVPGTSDYMWEYASDVTGPGYGTGWVNEHFINDGQPINQPSPGVPPCKAPPPPPAPGVSTGAASSVTQSGATLNASVNPNGGNVTDCHFEYGPTGGYGGSVGCSPAPGAGGSPVGVSAAIGSLSADTSYHFRVVATNGGGTSYGADVSFTTLPDPPTIASEPASAVTQTSATLNASVNPNGGDVNVCTVEYGPGTEYGHSVSCENLPGAGNAPVPVSAPVTGLAPNTIYHYRIVAANVGGTSYGPDQSVDTLPEPPAVLTGAATALSSTTATLNATVNPNGADTTCRFEYGPTVSYGATVPCASGPGSGAAPVAVSAELTGLSENATYHFRIVSENAGGSSYGADERFTTLGPPDFGRCVKVPPGTTGSKSTYSGAFTSSKCSTVSVTHTGKYEWEPGARNGDVTIGLASGTITMTTVSGAKISCTTATGSAKVIGTKELTQVALTFSGCAELSHPCTTSGETEGTISTSGLEGSLGWQDKPEQNAGLDLYPAGHTGTVMSFRCVGSTATTVTGSVIAPLPTSKMRSSLPLKFSASKGVQKPTHFEGEQPDVLVASLNGEANEQVGLTANLSLNSGEPLEINTAS